jgi:two-component system, NarL family, nitrate/nitrite response regulator NarL
MADPGTIRILLVDDHAILRAGLKMLIESQPGFLIIGEAGNRAEALAIAAREQPEVILLDIDMAGENGLDFLPDLLSKTSRSRVLVLTGVRDPEQHRKAFQLGATGLMLKEQATDILIKAIEKVHNGEIWLDRSTMANVFAKPQEAASQENLDPEEPKISLLTKREREVIALLGLGLTNKQIAERLFISQATVRHHVESVYNKLGMSSRFQLILYAYRQGLANPPL